MAHSMFCTDFVATVVYGGSAYAERGSVEDNRFDEGVRMGSMGLLLHSMTGKSYSPFQSLRLSVCVFMPVCHTQQFQLMGSKPFWEIEVS